VCGERLEIVRVGRENRAIRLGIGNDECVHGGACFGKATELSGATGEGFGEMFDDVAGLEELIRWGISSGVTLETLDEHDRRNAGRPLAGS
jgi:hypothetical protein